MRAPCASTIVTELHSTATGHGRAPSNPFNPEFAFWTLFELGASDKIHELLVVLAHCVGDSILGTGLAVMVVASTFQAVMFPADYASVVVEHFVEFEDCRTPRGRAP